MTEKKRYPTDFIDGDTGEWSVIFEGHGLDREYIESVLPDHIGPKGDLELVATEEWLHFVPRVKWCSKYDGWGCDNEGDWHGHWFPVRANVNAPDARFTIASWRIAPAKVPALAQGVTGEC